MTAKELAARIDGREAGSELTADEERQAEESGLAVLYAPAANQAVLAGAVKDTLWDPSSTVYISADGFLPPANCDACELEECPFYRAALRSVLEVQTGFRDVGEPFWLFTADVPHEKFRTFCGPDAYCAGMVFLLEDLPG